jgi:hypothetical protein
MRRRPALIRAVSRSLPSGGAAARARGLAGPLSFYHYLYASCCISLVGLTPLFSHLRSLPLTCAIPCGGARTGGGAPPKSMTLWAPRDQPN